jgi:hypothetical protein
LKGDTVQVAEFSGQWAIGISLSHLESKNFVRALHSFNATREDELSFVKGKVLSATLSDTKDWLYAFSDEAEGMIPATYVENTRNPSNEEQLRNADYVFQYTPLRSGEIRLIKFTRRDKQNFQRCGGDSIFFTLEHVMLDKAPPFTALSYCWGNAENQETVFCNEKLSKNHSQFRNPVTRV